MRVFSRRPWWPESLAHHAACLFVRLALGLAPLSLILSACGSIGPPQVRAATPAPIVCPAADVMASWGLVHAGQLTIASDTTHAPAEFLDPRTPTQPSGYDIDIARELARHLCLQPSIVATMFSIIIPDLANPVLGRQPYDLGISSLTITDAWQLVADMIPYFAAPESILTTTANAGSIKTVSDMCGKTIAVEFGSVEKDELLDANGHGQGQTGQTRVCGDANQIQVLVFESQEVLVRQILNGAAAASYQDQPVTDYYVSLHPGQLVDSGITAQTSPQGIALRNDNRPLEQAVVAALNTMRNDGTYLRILTTWGVQKLAYPPLSK